MAPLRVHRQTVACGMSKYIKHRWTIPLSQSEHLLDSKVFSLSLSSQYSTGYRKMSKTIFITGSSSGVGLASAKLFYEKGWNIVATMRTPGKDKELKQLDPSRMLVLRLDLTDVATIQPALDQGIKKFGKIDVLLNNAGYSLFGIFETFTPEMIQAQYQVNVFG